MGWIGFKFLFSRSFTRLVGKRHPLCPLFTVEQWGWRLGMLCSKWFGSSHFIHVSEMSIFWNFTSWMSFFSQIWYTSKYTTFWIPRWSLGFCSIWIFTWRLNLYKCNWLTKTIFAIILLYEEYCPRDINNIKQYKYCP